jgi:membrane protein YdbS with pleckstrin-like domain
MMPYQIWLVMLTFAGLCTFYSIRVRDKNNYTDAIAGVIATIFWLLSGLSLLGGIQAEDMTYASSSIMWIFIAVGVIVGVITIVKILDIVAERKNSSNHVHFGQIRL